MKFLGRHRRALQMRLDADQFAVDLAAEFQRYADEMEQELADTVELDVLPCACTWHYKCPEHNPLHPIHTRNW